MSLPQPLHNLPDDHANWPCVSWDFTRINDPTPAHHLSRAGSPAGSQRIVGGAPIPPFHEPSIRQKGV